MAARTATRKTPRKTATRKPPATTPQLRRSAGAAAVPPNPDVQEATNARTADLRDRTADILDTARWAGAQEAAGLIHEAEQHVHRIRQSAAADARRVLAEVADGAAERLLRAETEAADIRADARGDAQKLLDAARADADRATEEAVVAAETQVEQLLADAEKQVQEVLAEAEERASTLVAMRRASSEAAYGKALADAAGILAGAQQTAGEITAARTALDSELDLTRRRAQLVLDEELAGRRTQIAADLDVARAEYDRARRDLEVRFAELGEQYALERETQKARLAEELSALRANAEVAARGRAREILTAAEREKSDLVREATAALAAARQREADAEKYLADLQAAARRTAKREGISTRAWRAAPWVALAAGIGLAATGEYQLARLVGFHEYVAPLFPLSVDVYAVVAFKQKADVRQALAIMAASNLAYHLAERGGVHDPANPYGWMIVLGLTTIVVLTFVFIVYRVHHLLDGDHTKSGTASQPGSPAAPPAAVAATGKPGAGTGSPGGTPASTGTGNPAGRPASTGSGNETGNRPPTGTGNSTGRPASTATGNPGGTGGGKSTGKAGVKGAGKPGGNPSTPEQREAVRTRVAELLQSGETPSPTALAAEFTAFGIEGTEWFRNQIRTVRETAAARP
ncbi:hypothetical protein [Streptomyces sp. Isolate_45]|uniref:hypothetical protein n=1 Tax=Streptomyces sp. Isolate_45 TaxID=2950111 RepID=UPI0024820402|nr:hypothetical protein [Streptomyces sp. Isolate_45]MDA5279859.1 hypothetical protein [Streptomyces sp. Isolate_45]